MKKALLTYCSIMFIVVSAFSQTTNDTIVNTDTVGLPKKPVEIIDAAHNPVIDTVAVKKIDKSAVVFKPDPMKAVWMGAIIPGGGQIYNRKYWLLPLVYSSFIGSAYAITWNNGRFTSYKRAYIDATDNNDATNYHLKILPAGLTVANFGGETAYANKLKNAMNQFHQFRDLSILVTIGIYAVWLLQAYVDAQLYDFDISPDLVLNVTPARIEFGRDGKSAFGLQCSIRF